MSTMVPCESQIIVSIIQCRKHDYGNEETCRKVSEPETVFCIKELIEWQLKVAYVELRGQCSCVEVKYFPA